MVCSVCNEFVQIIAATKTHIFNEMISVLIHCLTDNWRSHDVDYMQEECMTIKLHKDEVWWCSLYEDEIDENR